MTLDAKTEGKRPEMRSHLGQVIAGCARCPSSAINPDWLPVSYFGSWKTANAWLLGINPSSREFVDRDGALLVGDAKRFATISEYQPLESREQIARHHAQPVLALQDFYFARSPYRAYFNRLGRFLSSLHGETAASDPLAAFRVGVGPRPGYRYLHIDVVKCATRHPWSELPRTSRAELITNCSPFLGQQLEMASDVRLLAINGRTAWNAVLPTLAGRFQVSSDTYRGSAALSASLIVGEICVGSRTVQLVGWSANVVNQRLTHEQLSQLSRWIAKKCPSIRTAPTQGATSGIRRCDQDEQVRADPTGASAGPQHGGKRPREQ